MSRSLEDLDPRFKPIALKFIAQYEATTGNKLLITSTRRWASEQEALYALGRTKPGQIVTHARAGQSAHEFGLALDACPLILGGKLAYNTPDGDSVADPLWQEFGRIARSCGLEWGGDWRTNREGPHVQVPNWKALISGASLA